MAPRPALLTKAEIARAIKVAKEQNCAAVEILRDGTVRIFLQPPPPESPAHAAPLAPDVEIVL